MDTFVYGRRYGTHTRSMRYKLAIREMCTCVRLCTRTLAHKLVNVRFIFELDFDAAVCSVVG